jgi:hypothetical protein
MLFINGVRKHFEVDIGHIATRVGKVAHLMTIPLADIVFSVIVKNVLEMCLWKISHCNVEYLMLISSSSNETFSYKNKVKG